MFIASGISEGEGWTRDPETGCRFRLLYHFPPDHEELILASARRNGLEAHQVSLPDGGHAWTFQASTINPQLCGSTPQNSTLNRSEGA